MNQYRVLLISLLAAVLAGCASTSIPDPEPSTESADAGASAYDDDGFGRGEALPDAASTELGMVIYFDFDQSELRPEYADLLARHANRLSDSPSARASLEGHGDERGSREYNIGLGERRSQTVRRMLLIQGASTNQLSTVSFGEEQPAALGSGEEFYALNRRVEIKYVN